LFTALGNKFDSEAAAQQMNVERTILSMMVFIRPNLNRMRELGWVFIDKY